MSNPYDPLEEHYSWQFDAIESWKLWCRYMALLAGSRRPETMFEFYFVESRGGIP